MAGGLMQLVAQGTQDKYLTGNPQITYFKVVYRRYTNFSMELIEQQFNGSVGFGKNVSCTLSRNGDLIHSMFVKVKLPQVSTDVAGGGMFRWIRNVGEALLKCVEIQIGAVRIDKHYSDWLHIWNELTMEDRLRPSYQDMVGDIPSLYRMAYTDAPETMLCNPNGCVGDIPYDPEHQASRCTPAKDLTIPLQFWFNRNPGLALPLVSMPYAEVKLVIEFESLNHLCYVRGNVDVPELVDGSLLTNYIYLDNDEKTQFTKKEHEYLIEQLQYSGDESILTDQASLRLHFNHPCKELIWVTQKKAFTGAGECHVYGGPQPFNYTRDWNMNYVEMEDSNGDGTGRAIGASLTGEDDPMYVVSQPGQRVMRVDTLGPGASILAPREPIRDAVLVLNGQDRMAKRAGRYFSTVQPYQHHTGHVGGGKGIYVYSFGLEPEVYQPSGTCNLSRVDNAQLNVSFFDDNTPMRMKIFATNYNVLKINNGMGGLVYSN